LLTWLTISKSDRYTTFSKLPLFWIDYYFRKACVRWFSFGIEINMLVR
jgi:hypothetical protein